MPDERDIAALIESERTVARLVAHYERAIERLLRTLAAGISRPGAARVTALLREITHQIDLLDPRKAGFARNWIRREVARAYVLGDRIATRDLRRELASLGGDTGGIVRTWTAVNQTAMRGIVAGTETFLNGAAAEMRRNLNILVRRTQQTILSEQSLREITVGGILRGETGRQVADDLAAALLGDRIPADVRRRLADIGFRADMFDEFEAIAQGRIITVGARRFSVRSYADLVARTQMREASSVGTIVRLQQNEIWHVKISQHPQDEPDECTPFAGKVFYIGPGEDPLGFPALPDTPNGKPPFHPNCKHVPMPYVVGLRQADEVEDALESSNAIPARFFGKGAGDVRKLVGEMSDEELRAAFAEGFSDIVREAA